MKAIRDGDLKGFSKIIRSLSCKQVYQLVYMVDNFGYSLIHLCAFFGRFEILKDLVYIFQ